MAVIPERIRQAWEEVDGPWVFVTSDEHGVPNAVYVKSISIFENECIVIADNKFHKTRHNLLDGCKTGSVLFLCRDGKAYQLKGRLEYHKEGREFDAMKQKNPSHHPGYAAAVLRVEACYCGSELIPFV